MFAKLKHSSLFCNSVNQKMIYKTDTSGLYYKPMTIVNDDSSVVNKLETSLTDNARGIIYDHHMFIVQAPVGVKHLFPHSTRPILTEFIKLGRFIERN